ncbi:hypothetical protein SLITO_v1c10950 [Spiroplasma litorale]|uniref:Uncharacterized protein n=1 Tax=Spiroplasma litorale TaxID=216942 RepID=A0A0K1W3D9_9MOLU|nr:hypothetical protein [Spiroplasma litorale]AKX34706.1 hypothetical protein SLITO_v1c10950 [Spiroplasma litorale]
MFKLDYEPFNDASLKSKSGVFKQKNYFTSIEKKILTVEEWNNKLIEYIEETSKIKNARKYLNIKINNEDSKTPEATVKLKTENNICTGFKIHPKFEGYLVIKLYGYIDINDYFENKDFGTISRSSIINVDKSFEENVIEVFQLYFYNLVFDNAEIKSTKEDFVNEGKVTITFLPNSYSTSGRLFTTGEWTFNLKQIYFSKSFHEESFINKDLKEIKFSHQISENELIFYNSNSNNSELYYKNESELLKFDWSNINDSNLKKVKSNINNLLDLNQGKFLIESESSIYIIQIEKNIVTSFKKLNTDSNKEIGRITFDDSFIYLFNKETNTLTKINYLENNSKEIRVRTFIMKIDYISIHKNYLFGVEKETNKILIYDIVKEESKYGVLPQSKVPEISKIDFVFYDKGYEIITSRENFVYIDYCNYETLSQQALKVIMFDKEYNNKYSYNSVSDSMEIGYFYSNNNKIYWSESFLKKFEPESPAYWVEKKSKIEVNIKNSDVIKSEKVKSTDTKFITYIYLDKNTSKLSIFSATKNHSNIK